MDLSPKSSVLVLQPRDSSAVLRSLAARRLRMTQRFSNIHKLFFANCARRLHSARAEVLTMKRILMLAAITAVALVPLGASAQQILSWGTMYGVDGGFVGHTDIRGVRGDELPWMVSSASGSLTTDGHLMISVRG